MILGNYDFPIAQAFADDKFSITALKEYLQEKADKSLSLTAGLQAALAAESKEEAIEAFTQVCDIPLDAVIPYGDGDLPIETVISRLQDGANAYIETGVDTSPGGVSVTEYLTSLNDDWTGLMSWVYACDAFNLDDSVDKLAYIREKLTQNINSSSSLANSAVGYVTDVIAKSKGSVRSFIESFTSSLSIGEEFDSDASATQAMTNNDFSQYTGCSPTSSIVLGSLSGAAKAVKVAGNLVVNAVKGIAKIVAKGFQWVATKVREVTTDPKDLENVGGDGEVCQGFYIDKSSTETFYNQASSDIATDVFDTLNKYKDKWVRFDTIWAENLFRISNPVITYDQRFSRYHVTATVEVKVKPKVLENWISWNNPGISNTDEQNLELVLNGISNVKTVNRNFTNDSSEWDMASALYSGSCQAYVCTSYELSRAQNVVLGYQNSLWADSWTADLNDYVRETTINNSEFVKLLCTCEVINKPTNFNSSFSTIGYVLAARSYAKIFIIQRLCSVYYPLTYNFLPYSSGYSDLSYGAWRIKTDSEVIDAFNNFLSTVIYTTVAVALTVTIGVKVRKFLKDKRFKLETKYAQLQNKMWNSSADNPVTAADQKSFYKLQRRLNLVKKVPDPTQLVPDNSQSDTATYQLVAKLISG